MADVSRLAGTPVMPDYRAYTVGDDGHFNGYEPLVCANDEEAITKARILAHRHGVELWCGLRLVSSIPQQRASRLLKNQVLRVIFLDICGANNRRDG
jgi:hypothetical protein